MDQFRRMKISRGESKKYSWDCIKYTGFNEYVGIKRWGLALNTDRA